MTRPSKAAVNEMGLAEAFRAAVPLAMAEMRTWTPDRRRRVGMPHGWQGNVGLADSLMFTSKIRGRTEIAFTTYARGLAVLAYEPGGVDLFGVHFCVASHDGCPNVRAPASLVDWAVLRAKVRASALAESFSDPETWEASR